jgi:hypothetical protein
MHSGGIMSKLLTWEEYDAQVNDHIYRLKLEALLTRMQPKIKNPKDLHNLKRYAKIITVYETKYNPDFDVVNSTYNLDNKIYQA